MVLGLAGRDGGLLVADVPPHQVIPKDGGKLRAFELVCRRFGDCG